ncbi:MAG: hypothetical protein JO055_18140 [Alphaproteobacteria bacterium]|nr:hypothetical protein [Alphaproteobacteria bacterium]
MVLALLAPTVAFAQDAPAPRLVWERPIELPSVEPEDLLNDAAYGVLRMVARPDGGVVIAAVEGRKGRTDTLEALRVVALDGTGKDLWTRKLAVPGGNNKTARMLSAAIDASDPARTWVFQSWSTRDDVDQGVSRIVGLNRNGGMEIAVANPRRQLAGSAARMVVRSAVKLTPLADGSLLALGTHYFGPPQWWYARYDRVGKLLWEQGSKGFPDLAEDGWALPDGGASVLMIDAENGPEMPTFRRIAADGRTVENIRLEDVAQFFACAVLIGPRSHVRGASDYDVKLQRNVKTEILWHEIGRGISHRIDTGLRACSQIVRHGANAIFVSEASEPDKKRLLLALAPDGVVRWRLELPGSLEVAALADGGAVVLREIREKDKPARLLLSRYASP